MSVASQSLEIKWSLRSYIRLIKFASVAVAAVISAGVTAAAIIAAAAVIAAVGRCYTAGASAIRRIRRILSLRVCRCIRVRTTTATACTDLVLVELLEGYVLHI